MRPKISNKKSWFNQHIFLCPTVFLASLLMCSTAAAELNRWEYKLIVEQKMILKCTQTLYNPQTGRHECLVINWVHKKDHCASKLILDVEKEPKEEIVKPKP